MAEKSYKTEEVRILDPLEAIDPSPFMENFERLAYEQIGRDHNAAFAKVASAAMQVSVEIAWPTIRKLAQKLRDEGPMNVSGWRFATTEMPDAWQIGFTAEHDSEPGGWLYNCVINPDGSPEGLEDQRQYREKRLAEGATTIDLIMEGFNGNRVSPETHPHFYLPQDECKRVSHFWACAYSRAGGLPPISEKGYGTTDLDSLKKSAKFNSAYVASAVVNVKPSIYLALDFGEAASNPDIPISAAVSDVPAGLGAMEVLSIAIRASGLSDGLHERAESLAQTRYEQYGEEYSRTLASIGAATAFRAGGIVGGKIIRACTDVWALAAGADATHGREDFANVVRMLEAHGHVSPASEYDCNDLDDFSFIERTAHDRGILWLRTEHGQYRIDFVADEDTGLPRSLTLSAQHEPDDDEDFEFSYDSGRKVSPDDEGFLARFRWDSEERRFVMNYSGAFHSRTIKDLNGVLSSIRSVSCCLEQDYPNDVTKPNV